MQKSLFIVEFRAVFVYDSALFDVWFNALLMASRLKFIVLWLIAGATLSGLPGPVLAKRSSFTERFIRQSKQADVTRQQIGRAIKNPEQLLDEPLSLPVSPTVNHQQPLHLSLRDAIYLSLRYSPEIQSAELDRVLNRYQLILQENHFELQYTLDGGANKSWPSASAINNTSLSNANVNAGMSLEHRFGGKTSLSTDNQFNGSDYNPSVTLEITQPLLRGAGRTIAERSLRDQQDSEITNAIGLKKSIVDKVTEVIQSYRALIQQNNSAKTQKQSLVDAEKTYSENETRIASGTIPRTANAQQSLQIATIKTDLQVQENSLRGAKQSLLTSIGLDPNMNINVPSDVTIDKIWIPDEEKTLAYALEHSPTMIDANIAYQKAKRAYVSAKNDQLWKLDLNASTRYGQRNGLTGSQHFATFFNGKNSEQQVGVKFSIPVRDLNRRNTLLEAKLHLEKSRIKVVTTKRQVETDIINTVRDIKTQAGLLAMRKEQLELAQTAYELELKKQEAGISSSLDVTNSQNSLINAKNSLIGVKIAYLNSRSKLEQKLLTTLSVWHLDIGFLQ